MREQQLITKQDLYSRYTYTCDTCRKEFNKTLDKQYTLHTNSWWTMKICRECAKNYMLQHCHNILLYKWELYWVDAWLPTRQCPSCWRLMYDDWSDTYCWDCSRKYYNKDKKLHYCSTCWWYHIWKLCKQWVTNNYSLLNNISLDSWINIGCGTESKSWSPKWHVKEIRGWDKYSVMSTLPFQEERKLSLDQLETLEQFYENNYHDWYDWFFDNYYFRQPVEIEWDIEYKRYDWLKKFKSALEWIETGAIWIKMWWKPSKYRNHFFQNISDDWLITWKYIDMFWGIREKKESINKFLKDNNLPQDTVSLTRKLYYRISSDIKHKWISLCVNRKLGSCQQPHNSDSYSTWAYDCITNGCNCPILLYNCKQDMLDDKDPIWRITCRIMYDEKWKMYLLLDRLYQDWSLSWSKMKWMMYKLIVEDLKKKGYKIIVTNYSAHDDSTLQYVKALWLSEVSVVRNLWQPLRRLFDVHSDEWVCGYYSDWWIEVYTAEINWLWRATDYLDKAYIL